MGQSIQREFQYGEFIGTANPSGEISKMLFEMALKDKLNNLHKTGEYKHLFWDTLIF